eukprot:4942374-Pleurochrysis_carterae.AAC.2
MHQPAGDDLCIVPYSSNCYVDASEMRLITKPSFILGAAGEALMTDSIMGDIYLTSYFLRSHPTRTCRSVAWALRTMAERA